MPAARSGTRSGPRPTRTIPNGKILRIKPIANATGVPGIGTTYTIPDGNLFRESQDTDNKTLPEIFAMGFRNPFRIHVDQKTGWVLMGDYGPDAGSANPTRGPQGSVEFNVVKQPGFYGWPYCIRENVPYHNITYTSDTGAGTDNGVYNCNAPVNDSPNNTGLTNLPPAIPATMWEAYTEARRPFPDLGTGGAPTGGTRYYFDETSDSETKFPRFYDGQWFIGEWNNDWVKTTTLNNEGLATGVACFAICTGYSSPHGHGVRPGRLAVHHRVGPGLRRGQRRLGALPDRLRRAAPARRSPTRQLTTTRCRSGPRSTSRRPAPMTRTGHR